MQQQPSIQQYDDQISSIIQSQSPVKDKVKQIHRHQTQMLETFLESEDDKMLRENLQSWVEGLQRQSQ